jgi:uncharacterized membrane protein (DUF2068 family)
VACAPMGGVPHGCGNVSFPALEIYELTERIKSTRIGVLMINIIAVIYLIVVKRLFGIRGDRARAR